MVNHQIVFDKLVSFSAICTMAARVKHNFLQGILNHFVLVLVLLQDTMVLNIMIAYLRCSYVCVPVCSERERGDRERDKKRETGEYDGSRKEKRQREEIVCACVHVLMLLSQPFA